MPKYYCDYCDVYLTHDSSSVRKAHNNGKNHIMNVRNYYAELGQDKAQAIIDEITKAYERAGQSGFPPQYGYPLGAVPPPTAAAVLPGGPPFTGPPPAMMFGKPPLPGAPGTSGAPGVIPTGPPGLSGAPPGLIGTGAPPSLMRPPIASANSSMSSIPNLKIESSYAGVPVPSAPGYIRPTSGSYPVPGGTPYPQYPSSQHPPPLTPTGGNQQPISMVRGIKRQAED